MVTGHYPASLLEACKLRKEYPDSILLCGGTDVMVVKKKAPHMIFLNQADDLKNVFCKDNILTIGACATYQNLLSNERIPDILKKAIRTIASPAVRSAGTVAGNICNASPAGDTLPVLYALDAQVVIARLDSSIEENAGLSFRKVPIQDFILGIRKIALEPDELVTAIEIPVTSYEGITKAVYEKVGARKSEAISKLSFVGLEKVENGIVKDIRIAFGAVNITAVRRKEIELKMIGKTTQEVQAMAEEIKDDYSVFIKPIDDQRSTAKYRKIVSLNLLTDFLTQ